MDVGPHGLAVWRAVARLVICLLGYSLQIASCQIADRSSGSPHRHVWTSEWRRSCCHLELGTGAHLAAPQVGEVGLNLDARGRRRHEQRLRRRAWPVRLQGCLLVPLLDPAAARRYRCCAPPSSPRAGTRCPPRNGEHARVRTYVSTRLSSSACTPVGMICSTSVGRRIVMVGMLILPTLPWSPVDRAAARASGAGCNPLSAPCVVSPGGLDE